MLERIKQIISFLKMKPLSTGVLSVQDIRKRIDDEKRLAQENEESIEIMEVMHFLTEEIRKGQNILFVRSLMPNVKAKLEKSGYRVQVDIGECRIVWD